jgi:outer membrane immunogenic protein
VKISHLSGAGLLLLALATPAFAADQPIKAPITKAAAPVAAVFNWSGWYAGLHVGYGWGHVTISDLEENNKMKGWLGGGQLGYNVQSGGWVWGAEIDGAWTDVDVKDPTCDVGCAIEGYVKIRSLYTARLRGGPTIGNTLYYLTGGFATGHLKYIDKDVGPEAVSKWHTGYTVGIGVEHAFAPGWSGRLEYLYVNLRERTYPQGTPDVVDPSTHLVRAALNYRFATGKAPGRS